MKLFKMKNDREEIRTVVSRTELDSLLKPDLREADIEKTCELAKKYGVASVLSVPYYCEDVMKRLEGTGIRTVCVIGYLGGTDAYPEGRRKTVEVLLGKGVRYFDIVMGTIAFSNGRYDEVGRETAALADLIHQAGGEYAVSIETGMFDEVKKIAACRMAVAYGADYVRTASGLEYWNGAKNAWALLHDVCLVKDTVKDAVKIKSGGRTDFKWIEDMYEFIQSGADYVDGGEAFLTQLENLNYEA